MKGKLTVLLAGTLLMLGLNFNPAQCGQMNISTADTVMVQSIPKGLSAGTTVEVLVGVRGKGEFVGLIVPLRIGDKLQCDSAVFEGVEDLERFKITAINNVGENPYLPANFVGLVAIPFAGSNSSLASPMKPEELGIRLYLTVKSNLDKPIFLETVEWSPSSQLSLVRPDGTVFRPVFSNKEEDAASQDAENNSAALPTEFKLEQNYPNPFNPETNIEFSMPTTGPVNVRIYNALGQVVKTLVGKTVPAGRHQVTWNGKDDSGKPVASGMYFCKVVAGNETAVKKMALLK